MVLSKVYIFDHDRANYARYSDVNDGYKYFAVFIDVLSHYVYTFPLKSLTSSVNVLKKVFGYFLFFFLFATPPNDVGCFGSNSLK